LRLSYRNRPRLSVGAALLSALFLWACSDLMILEDETLTSNQLLFLAQQAPAPAIGSQTFQLANSRAATVSLRHSDQFNTLFAELSFGAGAVSSVGDAALGPADSVGVTVTGSGADYRVTVSPVSIEFAGAGPTLRFSASVYGNFAVEGTRFATADELLSQLEVWEEVSPGTWQVLSSTVDRVRTTVQAHLKRGGTFALAAPR
jgi:hypothetical protein